MQEQTPKLESRLPVILDEHVFYEMINDDECFSLDHKIPPELKSKSVPLEKFGVTFPYGRQKPVVWRHNDLIQLLEQEQNSFSMNEERMADCEYFAELRNDGGKLLLIDFGNSTCDYKSPDFDGFAEALEWMRSDKMSRDQNAYYFAYIESWDRKFSFVKMLPLILFILAWVGVFVFMFSIAFKSCDAL